ncbi:MAG: hypothetical protein IJB86_05395 [Clostridia bacterium]|nr:hypothetical protein [Clostridia bacterium]MBQ7054709.1 hypothetical protein [Oscillospiraceae bacterium]
MKCKTDFSFIGAALITLMMIYDKSGNAVHGVCAAFFHESGHLFALLISGDIPQKISVGIYGIRIERYEKASVSYRTEAIIALSGPVFNLTAAAIMSFFDKDMSVPIRMNTAICLFNLLPLTPLDGGRALYYILCRLKGLDFAAKCSKVITVLGIIPLTVTGFLIFINNTSDYSLLLSSLYVSFALLSFPYS